MFPEMGSVLPVVEDYQSFVSHLLSIDDKRYPFLPTYVLTGNKSGLKNPG